MGNSYGLLKSRVRTCTERSVKMASTIMMRNAAAYPVYLVVPHTVRAVVDNPC